MPGGMSRSLGWSHLSAILKTEWGCETNPRRIDSHPCSLDPRAYQESANRMESCVHSNKINPVILFPRQSRSRVCEIRSRTVMVAVGRVNTRSHDRHRLSSLVCCSSPDSIMNHHVPRTITQSLSHSILIPAGKVELPVPWPFSGAKNKHKSR